MSSDTFDGSAYVDTYTERVGELIESKANGTALRVVKTEEPVEEVSDLLAALEASIKKAS